MSTVITQKRTAKSVSEVPKKEFRNYSGTLKLAARKSGEAFKTIARAQLKNATSQQEMKSILYHAANDTFEQYANATGKLACDFFEACIKDAKQTEIAPIPKYIKKRLYEDIEDLLADGAAVDERVLEAIADRVITESYHHGNRTTKHNAIRNGLRYARVPSGTACAFCLMLASRGFIYLSKISAGKDKGHYHNHCNCAVVAGNLKMKVGGYDPDGLNERMNKLAASLGIGDWTSAAADKELTKVLNRELAERDRRWVLNGKVPVVDYSNNPRENYGIRKVENNDYSKENFKKRKNEWRDLFVHDTLAKNGYKVQPQGGSDIDLRINGQPWEVKSPIPTQSSTPGSLRWVENNIKEAKRQFKKRGMVKKTKVIVSSYYYPTDDAVVKKELVKRCAQHNIKSAMFIDKQGNLKKIL